MYRSRMYRSDIANSAILHHEDDVVDLLHHCNWLIVSGLPNYKEHIFQRKLCSGYFKI